jgi:hypothetical protein
MARIDGRGALNFDRLYGRGRDLSCPVAEFDSWGVGRARGTFPGPLGKALIWPTTQTSAPTHLELVMSIAGASLDERQGLRSPHLFRIERTELRLLLG